MTCKKMDENQSLSDRANKPKEKKELSVRLRVFVSPSGSPPGRVGLDWTWVDNERMTAHAHRAGRSTRSTDRTPTLFILWLLAHFQTELSLSIYTITIDFERIPSFAHQLGKGKDDLLTSTKGVVKLHSYTVNM